MRILAIEISGRHGSLALFEGDSNQVAVAAETSLAAAHRRTAQTLAPALAKALAGVGWPARSIQLVAVTVGPGSFTGLRIGVTAAKIFAYAVGAEIIGVNSLEVLAELAPPSTKPLWVVMDAQRQELFVAKFAVQASDSTVHMTEGTRILSRDKWLAQLEAGDRVTGPPLLILEPRLPAEVIATPPACWEPTAAAVGRVAFGAYQNGQRDDYWKLMPQYYRASAAEERAARREPIG